jgi:dipicolinate synthase subunit A
MSTGDLQGGVFAMNVDLTGKQIAVLGGDDRELVFIPKLAEMGAVVKVVGFGAHQIVEPSILCDSPVKAIEGADAVIMPMPGTDARGVIRAVYSEKKLVFDESLAEKLPGTPVFIGVAKPYLKKLCQKHNVPLIEIAEMDEIAVFNSIPTAEGAIQIAMQETPFTIHKSHCFVLGYGRVGITLARTLKNLGAHTYVAARSERDLARIYEQCLEPVSFDCLEKAISRADIVFNTVPSVVLTSKLLERLQKHCLIIDLASAPGGTDFKAAEEMGIKAILAPGLPGKVAPETAGNFLAEVLPKLIVKYTT